MSFSLASDIVELVVLTTDDVFLQTLRDAVGGSRRLWHVPTADKVGDLLVAGEVGILVLDVMALQEPAGSFLSQTKRQFPDLIVVAAGKREAETSLAGLISAGVVYRFIHKPMSPGRAKLFADAAVKRYGEQRRRLARTPAAAMAGRPGLWLTSAAVAIGMLLIAISFYRSHLGTPGTAPRGGGDALELYRQSEAHDPAEMPERLSARVENALLEERLDEAAAAIEAARKAGVDGERIAFLTAQLARARGRQKSAAAQLHAADARTGKADADEERRTRALALAAQRTREDRLIEPDKDNARHYVQEALRIDPNNHAARSAKAALGVALLSDARAAIARRDFPLAVSVLDAANGIAPPSSVDDLTQLLRSARKRAEIDARNQLLKTGIDRMQQDRLLEPANDSAKHYLMTMRSMKPADARLDAALQELGRRFVAKARQALSAGQSGAARRWLDEAAAIGFASPDAMALRHDLDPPPGPKPSGQLR